MPVANNIGNSCYRIDMADITVAYCESALDSPDGLHVRALRPDETLVRGGWVDRQTLCGQDVAWDIDAVAARSVLQASAVCETCKFALATSLKDLAVLHS